MPNENKQYGYGSTISITTTTTQEAAPQHNDPLKEVDTSQYGGSSTVSDATLNFISSLIGAGVIGYGSAIAQAGGLVSFIAIIVFATMNKYAFDLVISLAIETEGAARGSFENLGYAAFGKAGRLSVIISKGLFIFGCLVVYIVIFKDNFSPAAHHLIYKTSFNGSTIDNGFLASLVDDSFLTTLCGSTLVLLPIILLRDVTPLAKLSIVKLGIFMFILCFVAHLYFVSITEATEEEMKQLWTAERIQQNWFSIHPGVIGSLGTFLFGFTAQHCVNIVFQSLKPDIRDIDHWKKVTTRSTITATVVSLAVGFFVYMTFWEKSDSNMFMLYTPTIAVDVARLLLSVSSLFTYPLPFFSLRELLILAVSAYDEDEDEGSEDSETVTTDNECDFSPGSLLPSAIFGGVDVESQSLLVSSVRKPGDLNRPPRWWLLPGEETQLIPSVHWTVTCIIYLGSLTCALYARSLGDVLNLVGCATGTAIAFVLPAIFSFKLRGYSHFGAFILLVGGSVGLLGTNLSLKTLLYG